MANVVGEHTIKANVVGGGTPISANIVKEKKTIKSQISQVPSATTEVKGIIRIATENEAIEGTSNNLAITPYTLQKGLDTKIDTSQYEQDIEEINEKIDNKLDDVEGSVLIEVERENQNITITSKTFVYEQGIASNEWIINHNLNKRPSINLVDSSGKEFEAERLYVSNNQVIIRLGSATTGKAYLN